MTLDKIIEIASKVQVFADMIAPGAGGAVNLGVGVARFLAGKWNETHPKEPIVLPPDPELIRRLNATSTRVVDTGTAFLDAAAE